MEIMEIIKYYFYYLESQFVGLTLVIQTSIFLMTVLAVLFVFSKARKLLVA